jgi:tetratricopeptide (TPR) repeat protein
MKIPEGLFELFTDTMIDVQPYVVVLASLLALFHSVGKLDRIMHGSFSRRLGLLFGQNENRARQRHFANSVKYKAPERAEGIAFIEKTLMGMLSVAAADLANAQGEEREMLEEKIDALNARLANPDEAFAQQQAIITNLEDLLSRRGNQLGGDAIAAAKSALEAGDFAKARALFETLAAETAPDVQTHADAAFALGQIAEAEIRWHDAANHYAIAARLNPTFDTLYKAREFALRAGDYRAASLHGESLIAIARKDPDQTKLATALNEHGLTLRAQGRYSEAEALLNKALEIARYTIGEAHPSFATHLNNLAWVAQAQGRYPEAEALFNQALEIDRKTIGEAHPSFAIHLNNLAMAVQTQGRYSEAEALFNQALEIGRKTIGEAHPNFAIHINNLALVLQAQGRYPEAEALYNQALEIDRKTIGEAHPSFALDINHLADLFQKQNRFTEAEPLYAQSLAIFRQTLGDTHPHTQATLKNYIHLLQTHNPTSPDLPALLAAFPNP